MELPLTGCKIIRNEEAGRGWSKLEGGDSHGCVLAEFPTQGRVFKIAGASVFQEKPDIQLLCNFS